MKASLLLLFSYKSKFCPDDGTIWDARGRQWLNLSHYGLVRSQCVKLYGNLSDGRWDISVMEQPSPHPPVPRMTTIFRVLSWTWLNSLALLEILNWLGLSLIKGTYVLSISFQTVCWDARTRLWPYLNLDQLLPVGLCQGFDLFLQPLHYQVKLFCLVPQVLNVAIIFDLQLLFEESTQW